MEALIAVCVLVVGMGVSLAAGLLLLVLIGFAGRALLQRVEVNARRQADPLPRMRNTGAL